MISDPAAAIRSQGVIGIIRATSTERAWTEVVALVDAGLTSVEVSLVTPDALDVVSRGVTAFGDRAHIGVGTVLTAAHVDAALSAGARFLVTPTTEEDVIRSATAASTLIVSGAATPTEAVHARRWGAPMVKIFPASLWSPAVLRDVQAALPDLNPVPTGGVSAANARDWIAAGAVALGVGSALTRSTDPRATAEEFLRAVRAGRGSAAA